MCSINVSGNNFAATLVSYSEGAFPLAHSSELVTYYQGAFPTRVCFPDEFCRKTELTGPLGKRACADEYLPRKHREGTLLIYI